MYAIKKRRKRGMIMILVLVLVALLLIVALAIITGSNNAAASATAVSIKYRVLNSAEGAANYALNDLAVNPNEQPGTHLRGSLNGATWDAWILANNLASGQSTQVTDPATGLPVDVPGGKAYVYGVGAENGGHTTYIEAMVAPGPPLRLPSGAMNAVNNILDLGPMAINADPADPMRDDANIHANNNIIGRASHVVQGATFAAGTRNDLEGDGGSFINANPQVFPTSTQISQAVRTASLTAQAGLNLTGDQFNQAGTHSYTGNIYIDGNVVISSTVVTLSGGQFVYINGNLCVNGGGQLINSNSGTSEIVVSGNVEIANGGSYTTLVGQNTLMLVLGSDNAINPCSTNNVHAVDFQTISGVINPIGTIFAPSGSIDLTGSGALTGALDSGADVRIEGTNDKLGMQYDMKQATTTLSTGSLTFQSYIEY
jgi:type II secretory pathway pseudopilin PulG